jgi:hypothetical protein
MLPVFIGGHPRSGTTLLGAMIGTHSACVCTPESQFKTRVLRDASVNNQGTLNLEAALRKIQNNWRFKIWDLPLGAVPFNSIQTYRDLVEFLVTAYGEKFGRMNPSIWVDHTPSNVKNAETLLRLFPDARFLHIVRDGRGVAASILPLDWGANTVNEAACAWLERLSQNLAVESALGQKRIMRVKFEDMVLEPETILKEICSFLHIDYQPHMTEGTGFMVPRYTRNQHAQVGNRPDPKEARAWEKRLTARQIEIFESIAGAMLLALGYPLRYGKKARPITGPEKVMSHLREIYKGKIVNKTRHWRRITMGVTKGSGSAES